MDRPIEFTKPRPLAKVKVSPGMVLRIELLADRYGGRALLLRLTQYAPRRGKGNHFAGESKLMLPAAAASNLISALTGAVASIEQQGATLRNVLQQGVASPQMQQRRRQRADVAEVVRLKAEGLSPAEIAGRLGCNRSTVGRILKKIAVVTP